MSRPEPPLTRRERLYAWLGLAVLIAAILTNGGPA